MARFSALLVLLTLTAPLAMAGPANGAPADAELPEAPAALSQAGAKLADGAEAVADGAASAASGATAAAKALARAAGAALSALGHGLGALGKGLLAALSATGAFLADAARLLGAALAFVGALLAKLAGSGASWVRTHPREAAVAAGSAGALAALAWLAKRFGMLAFLPLYTRLAPSEMLDNKVRSRVYAHVQQNPGAHPSAIAERLGLGWGTVVYHLARLEESKLLVSRASGHRKCYFATGSELNHEARAAVAAMGTDKGRLIVDAVRATPGISQKDLSLLLGMSQALTSWHVKRLVAAGVLVTARAGRSNVLHVAGHVPVMAAAPAALAA